MRDANGSAFSLERRIIGVLPILASDRGLHFCWHLVYDMDVVKDGKNVQACWCKRCGLIVLLAGKGEHWSNELGLKVPKEGTEQLEWEDAEWFLRVATQFDFENVCFSRDHKNLPGGTRILTCAGCERGVLGVAQPTGTGPDIKMTSFLLANRVSWEKPKN
jgi:hypothetical protein